MVVITVAAKMTALGQFQLLNVLLPVIVTPWPAASDTTWDQDTGKKLKYFWNKEKQDIRRLEQSRQERPVASNFPCTADGISNSTDTIKKQPGEPHLTFGCSFQGLPRRIIPWFTWMMWLCVGRSYWHKPCIYPGQHMKALDCNPLWQHLSSFLPKAFSVLTTHLHKNGEGRQEPHSLLKFTCKSLETCTPCHASSTFFFILTPFLLYGDTTKKTAGQRKKNTG